LKSGVQMNKNLSILGVWSDLWSELRANGWILIQAIAIPLVLTTILEQASQLLQVPWFIRLLGGIVYVLLTCLYAVSIHRIILIDRDPISNRFGLYWHRHLIDYIGALLAILVCLVPVVAGLFFFIFMGSLMLSEVQSTASWFPFLLMMVPSWALMGYVLSRLSIWLPARAVGDPSGYSELFLLSKGNGWRLTVTTMLPFVVVAGLLYPISNWMLENPGAPVLIPWFVITLFSSLIMVGLLSCAYRALRIINPLDSNAGGAPSPTIEH